MAAYDLKNEIIEAKQQIHGEINRTAAQIELYESLEVGAATRLMKLGILPNIHSTGGRPNLEESAELLHERLAESRFNLQALELALEALRAEA